MFKDRYPSIPEGLQMPCSVYPRRQGRSRTCRWLCPAYWLLAPFSSTAIRDLPPPNQISTPTKSCLSGILSSVFCVVACHFVDKKSSLSVFMRASGQDLQPQVTEKASSPHPTAELRAPRLSSACGISPPTGQDSASPIRTTHGAGERKLCPCERQ